MSEQSSDSPAVEPKRRQAARSEPGTPASSDRPARLQLRAPGLSSIYVGYVKNPELAAAFADDLGAIWPGMTVVVEATWEGMAEGGYLKLIVPFGEARAGSVADSLKAAEPLDVRPIEALMAPLGRFRASLGGRFDLRFLSFELQLVFHDPRSARTCIARGAPGDSSGGTLAPCFECAGPEGPQQLCRQGDAWPAILKGDPAGLDQLAAALAN
jgi:hypothetical protein